MTQAVTRHGDVHAERPILTLNGFLTLAVALALLGTAVWLIVGMARSARPDLATIATATLLMAAVALLAAGLYTLQPNEAAILQLRARNLNGERLKVNDKRGNPIEIAAVVVWRVEDTAKAFFDVDDYEMYVRLQAEAAVRHPTTRTTATRARIASPRCSPAPTSSPGRWCASSRRASTRPASWSRKHASRTSPTHPRSRR